tara:strand:+ start:366 stop:677 length:312 start_codon:yes stop_codon:yes gene_type:complete
MIIPIEKISEAVAETFRQIKTGVKTVRDEGVAIVELPDQKFGAQGVQFTMTVVAKDGLNAVERTATQSTGEQKTTETGSQNTNQTQSSGVGGSNTVETTYDYE